MEELAEQAFEKNLSEMGINIISDGEVTKDKPAIGEGGFGKVYKGKYQDNIVAIKKIKLEDDSGEKKDVYNEILSEIKNILFADHPNIPKFHGIWKNKGFYHLVFEFINGKSFKNCYVDMDKKTKLEIFRDLCEILKEIHSKKLIHRDIKPDNVMIEPGNKPRLIDFGVSKIASKTSTFTKVQMGTTPYMAPEMFDVDEESVSEKPVPVSTYSDIWSFGCMISEVFSGIKPWHKNKQQNLTEIYITSRLSSRAKFPIPAEIDEDVKELIERATAIDHLERPKAEDLKEMIDKLISKEK